MRRASTAQQTTNLKDFGSYGYVDSNTNLMADIGKSPAPQPRQKVRKSMFSFAFDFDKEVESTQQEMQEKAIAAPTGIQSRVDREMKQSAAEHVVNDEETWRQFKEQMRNSKGRTSMAAKTSMDGLLRNKAKDLEAKGVSTTTATAGKRAGRRTSITDFATSLLLGDDNDQPHHPRRNTAAHDQRRMSTNMPSAPARRAPQTGSGFGGFELPGGVAPTTRSVPTTSYAQASYQSQHSSSASPSPSDSATPHRQHRRRRSGVNIALAEETMPAYPATASAPLSASSSTRPRRRGSGGTSGSLSDDGSQKQQPERRRRSTSIGESIDFAARYMERALTGAEAPDTTNEASMADVSDMLRSTTLVGATAGGNSWETGKRSSRNQRDDKTTSSRHNSRQSRLESRFL